MPDKLTVIVPCRNESANIAACIASIVVIADEILIADSGSTDGTMEIARSMCECRIIEREYRTSGDFKNWAIPQASHDWVLLLDADERVTKNLAGEIKEILSSDHQRDGYWINRDNHFMGHRMRFGMFKNDYVTRLFKRDLSRYQGPSDHGEVQVAGGNVGRLKNRLLHYSFWTYDQYFAKFDRYTSLQARQWHADGMQTNALQLFLRPLTRFIRDYFLKLGMLDGIVGLQLSILAAFYTFTKQARLWALNQRRDQQTVEQSYRNKIAGEAPIIPTNRKSGRRANLSDEENFAA